MSFKKMKSSIRSNSIEAAIESFENKIDFEFLPVIAKKSSYTDHILWILSLLFLLLFISLIEFIFTNHILDTWISPLPFYLGSPILALIFAAALSPLNLINRHFIPKKWQIKQVQDQAELFFYRQHLNNLKSSHALVLYISVMERYIVLFHDPRIKIENMNSIDQNILKIIQASFKSKEYEKGLIEAIDYLKTALAPYYSRNTTEAPLNQIANSITWIDVP